MVKLLIADDEAFEREILAEIVDKRFSGEVSVAMAENGRQAVDRAILWEADILLLDIEMPGIDGIAAAKQILAQRPDCKVIFVTAYSLFTYAREAVKLGACDYVLKPVDPEEVARAVRCAIDQLQTQRQLEAMVPSVSQLEAEEDGENMPLLMGRVKKYLQHNYMLCDISLDSVSEILQINASYFSVLFKRSFGVNFLDYLTELRMNAARTLLKDPYRSTAEVAGMVGYESPNYFARAFKKKTGMTPTEYRRSIARREEGSGL
ncbi:MAG: response regulator [Faecousia sp.]